MNPTPPSRKPYPTDVSDDEWAFVAPYLTLLDEDALQRRYPLHEVFNAVRWIVRAGAPRRLLPTNLPPWPTVYHQAGLRLAAAPLGSRAQFRMGSALPAAGPRLRAAAGRAGRAALHRLRLSPAPSGHPFDLKFITRSRCPARLVTPYQFILEVTTIRQKYRIEPTFRSLLTRVCRSSRTLVPTPVHAVARARQCSAPVGHFAVQIPRDYSPRSIGRSSAWWVERSVCSPCWAPSAASRRAVRAGDVRPVGDRAAPAPSPGSRRQSAPDA